eukprot:Skav204845  [mRNA]  locus=scaffold1883:52294:59741:- [translate_table: standard]
MSQWRAVREGEESLDEVQIAYTCMAPGMDTEGITGLGPDGCEEKNSGASLDVACGVNQAIRSWQYIDESGTGSNATIDFVCCQVAPVDGAESNRTTTGTNLSPLELYQLASLNFDCPLGQALQSFSLDIINFGGTPRFGISASIGLKGARFGCINVPLRRNIKEPNATRQRLEWDLFRGSWVLYRAVNAQVRTPVVDLASTQSAASCPEGYAMVSWKMGNHGSEDQISALKEKGSEFHVLVLSRLTHRYQDYQNFGNIAISAQADAAAEYLNGLVPETMVLIADTEVSNFSSKLEYALQRCGAQLITSEGSEDFGARSYALIGIVRDADAEDNREALDEAWEEEYDKFCDVDFRTDLSGVDCEAESESCPEETHPCYHTYAKKIDENNWWTLTQRDIDRDYVSGIADLSQANFDADIAELEQWFDVAELIVTVVAGAAAAAAPGSYATPAEESAESGSDASEDGQKAAQTTRARSQAVAGPEAQSQLRSFQRLQKVNAARSSAATAGKAVSAGVETGRLVADVAGGNIAKEEAKKKRAKDGRWKGWKGWERERIGKEDRDGLSFPLHHEKYGHEELCLIDYQSQLIFYGLGQLRDQLKPTESEARALVQMDPADTDVEQMLVQLKAESGTATKQRKPQREPFFLHKNSV